VRSPSRHLLSRRRSQLSLMPTHPFAIVIADADHREIARSDMEDFVITLEFQRRREITLYGSVDYTPSQWGPIQEVTGHSVTHPAPEEVAKQKGPGAYPFSTISEHALFKVRRSVQQPRYPWWSPLRWLRSEYA
jgi:hypothetical protein